METTFGTLEVQSVLENINDCSKGYNHIIIYLYIEIFLALIFCQVASDQVL